MTTITTDREARGYVLDVSALLALVHGEPGADQVREAVPTATVSTVNWSEVMRTAARRGLTAQRQRTMFEAV